MHAAPSIILFTVLSGFGFGSLFFLGLGMHPMGMPALHVFAISGIAAGIGLAFSFFHLGHPERALKAFSQWRSSWLSREGWLAVVTLMVTAIYGALVVFRDVRIVELGYALSVLSALTIFATAMIYAQLKTVPRWNDLSVPVGFLLMAAAGGALFQGHYAIALALSFLQIGLWYRGDSRFAARAHTIGSATGLGNRGAVRAFEPPHTGTNYLLTEMVHVVGRSHAMKLRIIGVILVGIVPALILYLSSGMVPLLAALGVHLLGALTIRWLFFAEAEHVVGLYYGKR